MNVKYFFIGLLFYLHCQINRCSSEKITYFSTEHPIVNWFDVKVFKNFTMHSKRLRRQDPKYYVQMYIHSLIAADNNITVDFYFYQFLTNRYKPSFVEMHFKFCDMIDSDIFFGQPMRNAFGGRRCPFSPGEYDLKNLSIPYVPKGFPFSKGRIYCNGSLTENGVTRQIIYMSIDLEIKVARINKN